MSIDKVFNKIKNKKCPMCGFVINELAFNNGCFSSCPKCGLDINISLGKKTKKVKLIIK